LHPHLLDAEGADTNAFPMDSEGSLPAAIVRGVVTMSYSMMGINNQSVLEIHLSAISPHIASAIELAFGIEAVSITSINAGRRLRSASTLQLSANFEGRATYAPKFNVALPALFFELQDSLAPLGLLIHSVSVKSDRGASQTTITGNGSSLTTVLVLIAIAGVVLLAGFLIALTLWYRSKAAGDANPKSVVVGVLVPETVHPNSNKLNVLETIKTDNDIFTVKGSSETLSTATPSTRGSEDDMFNNDV